MLLPLRRNCVVHRLRPTLIEFSVDRTAARNSVRWFHLLRRSAPLQTRRLLRRLSSARLGQSRSKSAQASCKFFRRVAPETSHHGFGRVTPSIFRSNLRANRLGIPLNPRHWSCSPGSRSCCYFGAGNGFRESAASALPRRAGVGNLQRNDAGPGRPRKPCCALRFNRPYHW